MSFKRFNPEDCEVFELRKLEEQGETDRFKRLNGKVIEELKTGFMYDRFIATRKQSLEDNMLILECLSYTDNTFTRKLSEVEELHKQYDEYGLFQFV